MNVLLVLPGPRDSNNGYHAECVAKGLLDVGVDCTIAVPGQLTSEFENALPRWRSYTTFLNNPTEFKDGRAPDIVHAWTPRELVRNFCLALMQQIPERKLIVHLEDNEEYLMEMKTGRRLSSLRALPEIHLDTLITETSYHPVFGPTFIGRADALTLVVQTLKHFNKRNKPTATLPPLADERVFCAKPINTELRIRLGIPRNHIVLVYNGNLHAANEEEVFWLYQSVELLNAHEIPATLVRTGNGIPEDTMRDWPLAHVIDLGWVERTKVPEILAMADYFVQPGQSDKFNAYRLPSKLPEYFAIRRPVILPRANLGLQLRHGFDAYILDRANSQQIADAIKTLHCNAALRDRLTRGAADVFRRYFSSTKVVDSLLELYTDTLHAVGR